jgi:hypothetical protein
LDRSIRTRDTPWDPSALQTVSVCGTRVAETILASAPPRVQQTGRTYGSQPSRSFRRLLLQAGGRPHMDPGSRSLTFACPGRQPERMRVDGAATPWFRNHSSQPHSKPTKSTKSTRRGFSQRYVQ